MTLQLHHIQICIPIGAEDSAKEFYCGLLGLTEIEKPDSLKHRGGFWVRLEPIDLHIGAQDRDDRASSKDHIAYLVDDLESWKGKIVGYGLIVTESIPIPGFDRFETRDPFGNRVEFIRRNYAE